MAGAAAFDEGQRRVMPDFTAGEGMAGRLVVTWEQAV
jgi:hypothetical protein